VTNTLICMGSEVFWTRRLRWRLRGALMWPLFAILTVGDALLLHFLPPNTTGVQIIPGLVIASFANLFLIGVIAPFFARRLAARERQAHRHEGREPIPREVLLDRSAAVLLVLGTLGLAAAGLGNRPVIVSETKATEENAKLVEQYVAAHGTAEVKANLQTANSKRLAKDYFRTCINLNDRAKAFCMFVDTKKKTVVKDGDSRPNSVSLGGGF
jgi:hypothetical protein